MRQLMARRILLVALALASLQFPVAAQSRPAQRRTVYPGTEWERYAAPESAGYSAAGMAAVRAKLATMATSGLVVVSGGRVVFEHGDVDTVSYLASARKSVLSMLYGIHVERGAIDLDKTLEQLGIDDLGGLTREERQAKVRHLLAARSGVYHAASNPGDDLASAPPRGSQKPGGYYLYSNWDFNALGTIFEQMTKQGIYDALQRDIVVPIGMQDFNREMHRRQGDTTRSVHLAYHMHFSTRDMARIGYLMLRNGSWNGRQIIPASWVRESTRPITPLGEMNPPRHRDGPFGYGYLWWVWDGPNTPAPYKGAYSAQGAVGQYIAVLPALDLVVAHKTIPGGGRNVSGGEFLSLLDLIVQAKTGVPERIAIQLPDSILRRYVGEYEFAPGTTITITHENGGLFAQLSRQAKAPLFAESPTRFFYRATNAQIGFTSDHSGVVTGLVLMQSGGRTNPARKLGHTAGDTVIVVGRLKPAVRLDNRKDTAFHILDRMRYYHVPGVSIAVVDNFRIAYAGGFGVTEFGGNKQVDTTTLFLAGSISKPVFATGALKLVEEGKLRLDEDINRTLTSWKLPESRFTEREKVTLRRLLTHSAGLTVWGFPGYRMGTPIPTTQQVLDGTPPTNTAAVRNDTTPGARWLYSGGGITIAQLMTTDVTGESFPALMKRLVLDPAGMRRSTYENPLPQSRDAEAASGHERFDTPVTGRYHVYPEMAAAGLWTTAPELARWALALTRAYNGQSGSVLSPAMAQQMISKQQQQQPPYGNGFWGLGVGVAGEGDSVSFSHGGRDEGFVASAIMWPKLGRGLFVLTNGVSGALLAEINRAFADVYGHGAGPRVTKRVAPVDAASLAPLAGRYEFVSPNQRDTVRLEITPAADMLRMWDSSLQRMRYLLPEGGDNFFDFDVASQFSFERESGPGSRARALVLIQGQNRRIAPRVSP